MRYDKMRLMAQLCSSDGSDDSEFTQLIDRSMAAWELVDKDISQVIRVSRTTVLRWRSGASIPHPFMRASVLQAIARLVGSR